MTGRAVGSTSTEPPTIAATQLAFAICVALVVLNLYASQVLVRPITASYGIPDGATGLVTTAGLIGYSIGLLLLTPLADVMENRRLITLLLVGNVVALLICASAPLYGLLLVGAFTAGATSCAIQILIPLIASRTDESRRGQVIGNVMSGLMLGILLSRPLAGFAADSLGWCGFYIFCAVRTGVALLLFRAVSWRHEPPSGADWPSLIASLWEILRRESVVRQAVLRQALCMCAFNMFWTSVALRLSLPPFDLSERGIAIFALAGAAGVFAAPLAGWLGDRGQTRSARRTAAACFRRGDAIASSCLSVTRGAARYRHDLGKSAFRRRRPRRPGLQRRHNYRWFVDPASWLSVLVLTTTAFEDMMGRFVSDIWDAAYG